MQIAKNKTTAIAIAMLLILLMAASTLLPNTLGQAPKAGDEVPSYAFVNVSPNPAGVGQQVTINFFLSAPLVTSEFVQNMTIVETTPDGTTKTLGPFTSDATGGTWTTFTPDQTGNYIFQMFFPGQTLRNGVITLPSQSKKVTLVVQQEPVVRTAYPLTPLPSNYWQTPVSAQNVQNWYKIMGPWLGLGSVTFASTGAYNSSSFTNPYTESVYSGHVLWTKVWCAGGVVGGVVGGTEDTGSYWSTRQYWPQYAPVIMDGKMYSTWYPETTGYSAGILATDLYTGETLWRINTTNALRCGMLTSWHTINMYGVIGPYIWTTGTLPAADTGGTQISNRGTQWNLYSGLTGQYVLSVVNGTNPTLTEDDSGNLIGYYINSTRGTMTIYGPAPTFGRPTVKEVVTITDPVLCCFNMSQALGNTWGWGPGLNTVIDFGLGVMWAKPVPTDISGVKISPALAINAITNDAVVLTSGFVFGQGTGSEVAGWLAIASMDQNTGDVLMVKNLTYPTAASLLPYTRTSQLFGDGLFTNINLVSWAVDSYDVRTGDKVWNITLETPYGDGTPNIYDNFGLSGRLVNGTMIWFGLGGDIWAFEEKTGEQLWYTNTTTLIGDPGLETPYDTWPLWVFSCQGFTNDVAYLCIGHEYNPPLFHGAQILAINVTSGELTWSELGMYIRSTAIAYGKVLSLNAYDNQIYCFGKGPSATTVTAPSVGVTTATPITITGTVMDVSAGSKQNAVAANFPNGLPCVSDESQSKWMEFVYQQQLCPANVTGVPVTLSVIDSNGNYRVIGTTTTNTAGTYGFTWTPDIPGNYNVIASFAGSNSYYSSFAETYFYASEAPGPTAAPQYPQPIDNTLTIIGTGIVLLIAIAIVGLLLLRKK
jgi:hypothetical protein